MTKHKFKIFILFIMTVHWVGCSTLQKKFTRKKKEPAHSAAAVYLEDPGPIQKKFSNEYYYKTHFTFWTSWHDEMLGNLDGNQKKLQRASEEAWNHLTEVDKLLGQQKETELLPLKNEFEKIYLKIEKGNFRPSDVPMFRTDLERIGRLIASNFYYDKVKDFLVPDKVDLGN